MEHAIFCAGGCGKIQATLETDCAKTAARHSKALYCPRCSGKIVREKKTAPVSIHDELNAFADKVKSSGLVSPEDMEKALRSISKALKKIGIQ